MINGIKTGMVVNKVSVWSGRPVAVTGVGADSRHWTLGRPRVREALRRSV